jgi:ABC-type multidrug transport system ATPase subunit
MLTGLFEPNKGSASVFGIDVFEQMGDMRKILGVCPQHDVLFEFLTPKEHLHLFAAFKGTPPHVISELVEKMLRDIDLVEV